MAEEYVVLPEKDSDLIELALADLRLAEDDPNYGIYMGVWHERIGGEWGDACQVCLAGAVLAKTFKLPRDVDVGSIFEALQDAPVAVAEGTRGAPVRIRQLDDYRVGVDPLNELELPDVCDYGDGRERFHEDMAKVVQVLREAGR